ncbi:hypothetical protein SHIRM173S_02572 [Streptomyces hirsutus]
MLKAGGPRHSSSCPRRATAAPRRPEARCCSGSARRRSPSSPPTTPDAYPRAATGSPAGSPTPATSVFHPESVVDSPVCTAFEVYVQNIDRDHRLAPGAEVVLHWDPAHTFGLDAAQDADAGVNTVGEEACLMATVTQSPPPAPAPAQAPLGEAAAEAGPPDAVPAPAARPAVAVRLLRTAGDLPGLHLRPDGLPGGRLRGHLALRHLLGRTVRVLAAVRPLGALRGSPRPCCASCSATRSRI